MPRGLPRVLQALLHALLLGATLGCANARTAPRQNEGPRSPSHSTSTLAAPASPPAASPPSSEPTPGTLRVGTSGDYAPYSLQGSGFDVAVVERIANDLGLQVQWVPFTWPTLAQAISTNAFDLAAGGITWRPERAVLGGMSQALVLDGPCTLFKPPAPTAVGLRVGVNRGGILERWARERYPHASITAVDDNQSLPHRLAKNEVDLIVSDTAEAPHFMRPGFQLKCEPARNRKVYWVAPARQRDLLPQIDRWLADHESELRELRRRWLQREFHWSPSQHLVDLLARRLALMPAVAASKRAQGIALEDKDREALVLAEANRTAEAAGLEPAGVRALFALQIALAKSVQRRFSPSEPVLDLQTSLRPLLLQLGQRIVAALHASASELPQLTEEQLDLLTPWLLPSETRQLLHALHNVRRLPAPGHRAKPGSD